MATLRNWKAICARRPSASSSNTPPSCATGSGSCAPRNSWLRKFREGRLAEQTARRDSFSRSAYLPHLVRDDHHRLLQRARTGAVGILLRGWNADGDGVVDRLNDRGGRLVGDVNFAGGWFGGNPHGIGADRQRYCVQYGEAGSANVGHGAGARIRHKEPRAVW